MIKTFSKFLAATAVVVLTSWSARAAMLSGTYTNYAMQAYVPVWDVSGAYTNDITDVGTLGIVITNAPDGKYADTELGTLDVGTVDGYTVDLTVTNLAVSGALHGTSKKPEMSMKIEGSLSDLTIGAVNFKTITDNFTGSSVLDTNDLILSGKGESHYKFVFEDAKTKGKYVTKDYSIAVKDLEFPVSESAGDWTLVLNLTQESDTKYSGTAAVLTSALTEIDFATVTGTYSAKTDKSTLTLKGLKGSNCDLTLEITDSDVVDNALAFDSVSGKLLGQTLSYKAPKE